MNAGIFTLLQIRRLEIFGCLLVVFSLFLPDGVRASILSQTSKSLPAYSASLSVKALDTHSPAQLSLLNRKLLEQGHYSKSSLVISRLAQIADWSVKPIVAVERIKVYLKKGEPKKLLIFLSELSGSPDKLLYEKVIYATLQENFSGFADSTAVIQTIDHLLKHLDGWRRDPELIKWTLQFSKPGEPQYKTLVQSLWASLDVTQFPEKYLREIEAVRRNPRQYQDIIALHFSTQYRKRNWTYLLKEAPVFLSHLEPGSEAFNRVRDTWFRTYFRKRQYSTLIEFLQKPKNVKALLLTPEKRSSLLFRLWLKKGFIKEARKQLALLEQSRSYNSLGARYFELAEFYFNRDRFSESLPWYLKISADNVPVSLFQLVQWRKLWAYYRIRQPQKARVVAEWAKSFEFDSREVAAKFCYWGVKLDLLKDRRALSCYQEYPLTYYGFRSLQTGKNYAGIQKTILASSATEPGRSLRKYEREFLEVLHVSYLTGDTEFTDTLVTRYMKRKPDLQFFRQLASVLFKAQRYYLQQLLVELYFKDDLQGIKSTQHPLLSIYYPAAYGEEVKRHVGKSTMPHQLALAVMREESNFRPEVESPAGAVGLMQLMPSTAKYVAKIIRTRYDPDFLILPDFNVKLGVAYLKRLLRRYKGNLFYTLAAYNGGATNVKRWKKKAHSADYDIFVETITYIETQNYVKRVLRSYHIYQLLYRKNSPAGFSGPPDTSAGRLSDDPA